ncbi:MAG: aminotransferase class III-fold pyridoxal phosphate-dependent enzyme, partial [Mariprofundaceae bacterium]|nr:aminotransferase class III-fold pyridoxal phosphate-dependent enzyme [Mariprofundaceae bacterium]
IGAVLDETSGITAADIIVACREAGLLILPAGPQVLRFLPPLNVTAGEVDEALEKLSTALQVVGQGD